jgi:hypothetical protein
MFKRECREKGLPHRRCGCRFVRKRRIGFYLSAIKQAPVGELNYFKKNEKHGELPMEQKTRDTELSPKPKGKKNMVRLIIGIAIGAVAGFAYYKFVGCSTGMCPLTSNPVISTIYGAVMGALLSSMAG